MPNDVTLREHLVQVLDWTSAHADFDAAIQGISPATRGQRPEDLPYSPWELLEHIRIAQNDILEFCQNSDYAQPDWPADYWPEQPGPSSDAAWQDSIDQFRGDREEMKRIARDTPDLYAEIPHGDGQTYVREILLVADHNAYHLGQLVAVRRLLGEWDSDA